MFNRTICNTDNHDVYGSEEFPNMIRSSRMIMEEYGGPSGIMKSLFTDPKVRFCVFIYYQNAQNLYSFPFSNLFYFTDWNSRVRRRHQGQAENVSINSNFLRK